jgi:hypothetical protein
VKVSFGDLPHDAKAMLTRHLRIDFSHCNIKSPRWFSAWARNERGHVVGIFVVEFQTWFEGKVTALVLDPRCLSRRVLRAIFTALFSQVKRLTAEVEPDNRRALRQVQRLGFHFEGHHPLGLEGCRDTIVFGMLKEECCYLPGYIDPAASTSDISDRVVRDAKAARERAVRFFGSEDFQYLYGRKYGARRHAARSVDDLVGHVALASIPADMSFIDARTPVAAVRGFMAGRG